MALVAVELETLVSEPDALTTRPPSSSFKPYLTLYIGYSCSGKLNSVHFSLS